MKTTSILLCAVLLVACDPAPTFAQDLRGKEVKLTRVYSSVKLTFPLWAEQPADDASRSQNRRVEMAPVPRADNND